MIPKSVYVQSLRSLFAPITPYLDDPSVSEILINGPSRIYVERRGRLELVDARFQGREALMAALRNLSQYIGKPIDERQPILEGRLPDGSRVEAIIPPVSPDGPSVAIRRFFRDELTMDRLIAFGSISPLAVELLRACVIAKINLVIAGGTGSGKTSLLNALSGLIPEAERVVVIEDVREVQLQMPHVVQLEARPADARGEGAITIRDLFRATLRMRPDRVIVGEIRGGEALDIVQAMTSGHGGCMGTLHASHPRDALTRLETMTLMSDLDLPLAAARVQIGAGVQLVVQVARLHDGSRKITHISEVRGFDLAAQRYVLTDLFVRRYVAADVDGDASGELVPTGELPSFLPQLREHGVTLPSTLVEAARRELSPGLPNGAPRLAEPAS